MNYSEEKAKEVKEDIQTLLDNESITSYHISKETGINQTTIGKLRSGERSIDEMKFRNAMALYRLALTVPRKNKINKVD